MSTSPAPGKWMPVEQDGRLRIVADGAALCEMVGSAADPAVQATARLFAGAKEAQAALRLCAARLAAEGQSAEDVMTLMLAHNVLQQSGASGGRPWRWFVAGLAAGAVLAALVFHVFAEAA